MLLPGTQMHVLTFIFVCIEIVILFYLLIYRAARPDDKTASLNIVLIFLLICYNVASGLLPDQNLPGSIFLQNIIAYATGFITPCYFPFYVYKAFGLKKMKFHAYKGVYMFLIIPYFVFVAAYAASANLNIAKNFLILPVMYALWVIITLIKALQFKYLNDTRTSEFKEELSVLFFSISSWIGVPIIDYFNLGQASEAAVTNAGFLMLLGLQVKRHIKEARGEHQKLIESEKQLLSWNTNLQNEVDKRTRELKKINEQKTNTFVNLAHETKTPLTLINNYLEDYINERGSSEELTVVKKNLDKLTTDIVNFFDLERFSKGIAVYNHTLISNFSEILQDNLVLFKKYAAKRKIQIVETIEEELHIQADPVSINRIIKNLIENAIKFSKDNCEIQILLYAQGEVVTFSIKDCGKGILPELHNKVFEPYYQITNQKESSQGMGLGLPIVKKVIQDLNGKIQVESNPAKQPGTKMIVSLSRYILVQNEVISMYNLNDPTQDKDENVELEELIFDPKKNVIFLVEDNISMVNYLIRKLQNKYNVFAALNGNDALKKLNTLPSLPNLIISDVMMDKVDGFTFAKIISQDPVHNHIPFIFLTAKSTKRDKLQGLSLGAIDFIHKPFNITELIQKIDSIIGNVARQKQALVKSAVNVLNTYQNQQPKDDKDLFEQNCKVYNLTIREKDIVKLITEGYKYKAIGEELFISERTVTKHVQNIFEKVDVSNKVELINKLAS